MRVVAERADEALGPPHRWRLRRVTRHRVAELGLCSGGISPFFMIFLILDLLF